MTQEAAQEVERVTAEAAQSAAKLREDADRARIEAEAEVERARAELAQIEAERERLLADAKAEAARILEQAGLEAEKVTSDRATSTCPRPRRRPRTRSAGPRNCRSPPSRLRGATPRRSCPRPGLRRRSSSRRPVRAARARRGSRTCGREPVANGSKRPQGGGKQTSEAPKRCLLLKGRDQSEGARCGTPHRAFTFRPKGPHVASPGARPDRARQRRGRLRSKGTRARCRAGARSNGTSPSALQGPGRLRACGADALRAPRFVRCRPRPAIYLRVLVSSADAAGDLPTSLALALAFAGTARGGADDRRHAGRRRWRASCSRRRTGPRRGRPGRG